MRARGRLIRAGALGPHFPGPGSDLWPLLPCRLQGALKPSRGGGASREGLCVPGGVLQTQVPRAARKVGLGGCGRPAPALQTLLWVRGQLPSPTQGSGGPRHSSTLAGAHSQFPAAPPDRWALCCRTVGTRGSRARKPRRCFPLPPEETTRGRALLCSARQGRKPAHSRCFTNVCGADGCDLSTVCLALSLPTVGLGGLALPPCRVPRAGCTVDFWEKVPADRLSRFLPPLFRDRPLSARSGWGPGPQAWLCPRLPRQPAHTRLSV